MTNIYDDFLKLKSDAGLHSPSVSEIKNDLKINIEIDACFLCNPYAFDLFIDYFNKSDTTDFMKYYPPQNHTLAKLLSKAISIDENFLMLGNGAIQLIELILREYEGKRKCIITPTFSSYYEFDSDNIVFFITKKETGFTVDPEELVKFCNENHVEVLVIVNPNNPTGGILSKSQINFILKNLKNTIVIVDESFIDFFDRSHSMEQDVYNNLNLIVIRSLSKDFGIAGLRLGYAVSNPILSKNLFSKYGLCWNINGLAHFFIELLNKKEFIESYKSVRDLYVSERAFFYQNLSKLQKFKVYDSKSNFFIIDCFQYINEVFFKLLFEHKIYTRILNDKLHLEPSFLRIACGTQSDNLKVFNALLEIQHKI